MPPPPHNYPPLVGPVTRWSLGHNKQKKKKEWTHFQNITYLINQMGFYYAKQDYRYCDLFLQPGKDCSWQFGDECLTCSSFSAFYSVLWHMLGGSAQIVINSAAGKRSRLQCYCLVSKFARYYGLQQIMRLMMLDVITIYRIIYANSIAAMHFSHIKSTGTDFQRWFLVLLLLPRTGANIISIRCCLL